MCNIENKTLQLLCQLRKLSVAGFSSQSLMQVWLYEYDQVEVNISLSLTKSLKNKLPYHNLNFSCKIPLENKLTYEIDFSKHTSDRNVAKRLLFYTSTTETTKCTVQSRGRGTTVSVSLHSNWLDYIFLFFYCTWSSSIYICNLLPMIRMKAPRHKLPLLTVHGVEENIWSRTI